MPSKFKNDVKTKFNNNLIQKDMKIILKKPLRFTVITTLCLVFVSLFVTYSCDKHEKPEDKYEKSEIEHVKTELGGCNAKNDLTRSDSDVERDTVIITISENFVNVFVCLEFTCKRDPFETRVEIIDDVMYMHISDTCDGYDEIKGDCYARCYCHYTFDFVFEYQGEINQKYKILLHKNLRGDGEEPISIFSEGIITNNTNQ